MNPYDIIAIPTEERPRERLNRLGADALSNVELLAILLGSGIKTKSVLQLSQEIFFHFGSLQNLFEATVTELCSVKGLGNAKALQLKAALHLGKRASIIPQEKKVKIDTPSKAYIFIKDELENEKRELFVALFLDIRGFLISKETIAIGTLTETLVHPREIFYPAIRHKAASLIVAHNHPSGDSSPSQTDIELTKKLIEAGKLMHIPLDDHLIIGKKNYTSLREIDIIKFK